MDEWLKQYRKEHQRELGAIDYVRCGDEDHNIPTVDVGVDFGGSHQGFGNLCLRDGLLPVFVGDLCKAFGVESLEKLKGKRCYALRCWGFNNDTIEGLESVDTGQRFVVTAWCKAQGLPTKTPLERRIERAHSTIQWARRRADDCRDEIETAADGYVDWSAM